MKRFTRAIVIAFAVGVALLPGTSLASHRHHGLHAGFHGSNVAVFIGHGHPPHPGSAVGVGPGLLVVERLPVGLGAGAMGLS